MSVLPSIAWTKCMVDWIVGVSWLWSNPVWLFELGSHSNAWVMVEANSWNHGTCIPNGLQSPFKVPDLHGMAFHCPTASWIASGSASAISWCNWTCKSKGLQLPNLSGQSLVNLQSHIPRAFTWCCKVLQMYSVEWCCLCLVCSLVVLMPGACNTERFAAIVHPHGLCTESLHSFMILQAYMLVILLWTWLLQAPAW